MVKAVYPEHEWIPWKFDKVPANYWRDEANRNRYWEWLAKAVNVTAPEQWYEILDKNLVMKNGGSGLLSVVESMVKSLASAYPDHKWHFWKFRKVSRNYWRDSANRRAFVEWVAEDMGLTSKDEWYQITLEALTLKGGIRVVEYHKTVINLFTQLFPEHKWLRWKFRDSMGTFWNSMDNQREYLNWLYEELKLEGGLAGWYKVMTQDVQAHDGATLLVEYKGSLSLLLMSVYSKHEWEEWKFTRAPQRFWHDVANQRRYLDALMLEWGYNNLSDWYQISRIQMKTAPGSAGFGPAFF
jgi:hypothetical protein